MGKAAETTITSWKSWLWVALLGLFYSALVLGLQWDEFTEHVPLKTYEQWYSQSQYVMGEAKKVVLGDEDIYAYAGIRYVQGEDPTSINFEHPPLAKYLFGLSYSWFGSPNWFNPVFMLIAIGSFYFIAVNTLRKTKLAFYGLGLFLAHSVIWEYLHQTMLDIPLMATSLFVMSLYLMWVKKKQAVWALLFGLGSGLFLLVKYPFPIQLLLLALIFAQSLCKKLPFTQVLLAAGGVMITYLLGYTNYFLEGNNLLDWLKFEWWRLQWYMGKTENPGAILLKILFTGKYQAWWTEQSTTIKADTWNIYWPLHFSLYLFSIPFTSPRLKKPQFIFQLWIILTLAAYLVGADRDRFLVLLVPGFSLSIMWALDRIIQMRKREV